MKDLIYDEFQNAVEDVLIRHSTLLDIITKLQGSVSNTNRAAIKTITSCGCMTLNSAEDKGDIESYDDLKTKTKLDLGGEVCPVCREKIEEEMGDLLFYLAALGNKLDINLYDVLLKEYNKITTLGKFTLY